MNMAAQCLEKEADKLAIIDLTSGVRKDVTFAVLQQMTDNFVATLINQIKPGDRVGVLLSQSPECAAAHLAIWKIGAISVPLFKLFQHDALKTRLHDAGCSIVLTDADGAVQVGTLAPILRTDQIEHCTTDIPYFDAQPDTPAVLIYTSGTTGSPKGALHGHRILDGHIPGVSISHDALGQDGDCLWTPADWAWIGGLFDVLMPGLSLGIPVVATPMSKFSPDDCQTILDVAKVRNVFFPPTALRMLKASQQTLSGLRSVASGGEPLGAEMLAWGQNALGVTINEFYGQTECNMVVSSCATKFAPRPGCMGQAVPGFDVEVIDDAGRVTPYEGDIAIRIGAPSMMLRYWNKPEDTAAKFRGNWMLTGDRGLREDAFIRFVGREDDVITSSGYRIGPAEIEDCLMTHPDVATVGVVGKPDPVRTQIVKAYVVLKERAVVTDEDLQNFVKDRLARYSYPREIEFVSQLPMTVTGKVIRKQLKARAARECVS